MLIEAHIPQLNFEEITDYSLCGTKSKKQRFLMTVLFILS
jgi:hypothetical protein